MKYLYLIQFLFGLFFTAHAQQKAQYSQYMFNNYLLNPAIAGIEDYADIKLGSRKQWVGVDGAPLSFYLSAHTKIGGGTHTKNTRKPQSATSIGNSALVNSSFSSKPRHGIGALILHDRIGPFSRSEASLSYAYHLPVNAGINLAAGTSVGLIQQALNPNKLTFADPDHAGAGWNVLKPNFTVGLWLYSSSFYLGVSGTQLLGNSVHFDNTLEEYNSLYNHYFVTAAYKFPVTETINLIPSVMAKWMQPMPGALDFNIRLQYLDRIWGGASYRQNDSFAFIGGLSLNPMFEVGYSYDTGISSLGNLSSGSHEVVLGVRLSNSRRVLCPQNMW